MTIVKKRRTHSHSPHKRNPPTSDFSDSPTVYGHSTAGTIRFPPARQEGSHEGTHYGKMIIDDDSDSAESSHGGPPPPVDYEQGPDDYEQGPDEPLYLFPEYNPVMSKHRAYRLTQALRWMNVVIPHLLPVFLRVLRESKQLRDFSGVTPRSCGSQCSQKKLDVHCISFGGTVMCIYFLCGS